MCCTPHLVVIQKLIDWSDGYSLTGSEAQWWLRPILSMEFTFGYGILSRWAVLKDPYHLQNSSRVSNLLASIVYEERYEPATESTQEPRVTEWHDSHSTVNFAGNIFSWFRCHSSSSKSSRTVTKIGSQIGPRSGKTICQSTRQNKFVLWKNLGPAWITNYIYHVMMCNRRRSDCWALNVMKEIRRELHCSTVSLGTAQNIFHERVEMSSSFTYVVDTVTPTLRHIADCKRWMPVCILWKTFSDVTYPARTISAHVYLPASWVD